MTESVDLVNEILMSMRAIMFETMRKRRSVVYAIMFVIVAFYPFMALSGLFLALIDYIEQLEQ